MINRRQTRTQNFTAWLGLAGFTAFFLYSIFNMTIWERVLSFLFPKLKTVIYPRVALSQLVGEHLILVTVSSLGAAVIGIPFGIFVTRKRGNDFKEIVNDLGSLSQTIPPAAVLALAVPLVGFGFKPTILALFLYSILPILRNTISGLEDISPFVIEAARGMGMTPMQLLFKIELPLAAPVIFAGVRISVIVNVGTTAIGAVVGAGGLGNPIISGLIQDNQAYILEGAVTTAFLAVLLDQFVGRLEKHFTLVLK